MISLTPENDPLRNQGFFRIERWTVPANMEPYVALSSLAWYPSPSCKHAHNVEICSPEHKSCQGLLAWSVKVKDTIQG